MCRTVVAALVILLAGASGANANDRNERKLRGGQQGHGAQEQRREEAPRAQENAINNERADEMRALRRERAKTRRIERGEADPRF